MRLRHLILLVCLIPLLLAGDRWGRDQLPAFGRGEWGRGDITAEEWLPSDITGVQYWWRADQGVTYGSAAPACTSWTDIIAGKIAYAGSAAGEPTYYTGGDGINGQPVIKGGGSDDYLKTAAFASALSQPFTVWCVATIPTDNAASRASISGITAGRLFLKHYNSAANVYALYFPTSVLGSALPAAGTDIYHLLKTENTGAVVNDTLWANGTAVVTGNAGANTFNGLILFAYFDGAVFSSYSDSKVAEIGLISGTILAADEALLEAYTTDRYGVVIAFWDGYDETIMCMTKLEMIEPMMMFLTIYSYQGRSRW